jgi:hypothetical protein
MIFDHKYSSSFYVGAVMIFIVAALCGLAFPDVKGITAIGTVVCFIFVLIGFSIQQHEKKAPASTVYITEAYTPAKCVKTEETVCMFAATELVFITEEGEHSVFEVVSMSHGQINLKVGDQVAIAATYLVNVRKLVKQVKMEEAKNEVQSG